MCRKKATSFTITEMRASHGINLFQYIRIVGVSAKRKKIITHLFI